MSQQHRFWWRVVWRYDEVEKWAQLLRLGFIEPSGAIRLKSGYPLQRQSYRKIQAGLAALGYEVSPTRAQQLVNEALARAVFAYYRSVIPPEVDRSVIIENLMAVITEGRREKTKKRRAKQNGVHRVIDEVHLWLRPDYAGDSADYPTSTPEPGRADRFIIDWLAQQ